MTSFVSRYSKNNVRIAERFAELLFPEKLWYVVNDDDQMFQWTDDGASFSIDENYFVESVLNIYPGFLQVNLFANVRRLLREYGFTWDLQGEKYVFTHSNFLRGHPELVQHVTRWRTRIRSKSGRRTILHKLPKDQISTTPNTIALDNEERIKMIVPNQTKTKKFRTIVKGRNSNSCRVEDLNEMFKKAQMGQSTTNVTKDSTKSTSFSNFPRNFFPVSSASASNQRKSCEKIQFTTVKDISEERDPILEHNVWSALFDDSVQGFDQSLHPHPTEIQNAQFVNAYNNGEYIFQFDEM